MDSPGSASERAALAEQDDGFAAARVWHLPSHPTKRYHDRPTCRSLTCADVGEPSSMTREAAKRRHKAPCRHCVLDRDGGPADP